MHSSFLSALALLTSVPEGEPADASSIAEQLQCVLQDYSADDQRDLDAWAQAYEYGKSEEDPVNFRVSLARAKQCKELLSWTSQQETMAGFHGVFLLEESASNAVMPIAKKNVTAFYASLDEKETKAMERALAVVTSGMVDAVGDEEEPSFIVLLATYAVDQKIGEKLPEISDEDKARLLHLLLLGTTKDLTRQMFEKEALGEMPADEKGADEKGADEKGADEMGADEKSASEDSSSPSEPPPGSPPRERPEQIPSSRYD
jgi:hypothetical protein